MLIFWSLGIKVATKEKVQLHHHCWAVLVSAFSNLSPLPPQFVFCLRLILLLLFICRGFDKVLNFNLAPYLNSIRDTIDILIVLDLVTIKDFFCEIENELELIIIEKKEN